MPETQVTSPPIPAPCTAGARFSQPDLEPQLSIVQAFQGRAPGKKKGQGARPRNRKKSLTSFRRAVVVAGCECKLRVMRMRMNCTVRCAEDPCRCSPARPPAVVDTAALSRLVPLLSLLPLARRPRPIPLDGFGHSRGPWTASSVGLPPVHPVPREQEEGPASSGVSPTHRGLGTADPPRG